MKSNQLPKNKSDLSHQKWKASYTELNWLSLLTSLMEQKQLCRMTKAGKKGDNIPHRFLFNIVCFITEHMIKWLYGSTKQNQAAQDFFQAHCCYDF